MFTINVHLTIEDGDLSVKSADLVSSPLPVGVPPQTPSPEASEQGGIQDNVRRRLEIRLTSELARAVFQVPQALHLRSWRPGKALPAAAQISGRRFAT